MTRTQWWTVAEIQQVTGLGATAVRELVGALATVEASEMKRSGRRHHEQARRQGGRLELAPMAFDLHFRHIVEAREQERAADLQRQFDEAHLAVERRAVAAIAKAAEAVRRRDATIVERMKVRAELNQVFGLMPPRYVRRLSVRQAARRHVRMTSQRP